MMKSNKIIKDDKYEEIILIISTLTKKVTEKLASVKRNGLLNGLAGHLLFLYNVHQFDESLVDESLFLEKMEELQGELSQQSLEFCDGLAGQAWLLEYFNQANAADYDSELLVDIDKLFIESLMGDGVCSGEIEIISGISGFVPYASKRSHYTDQESLYSKIISVFANKASYFEGGQVTWAQPIGSIYRFEKEDNEVSEYNLGFAHGVPGIISALLPALQIPSLEKQVRQLLTGSCDWLLCNQNKSFTGSSCFGSCAGEMHESRLGWCYGDLTIALTLARVGNAIDNPYYVECALNIALHAAKRDAKSGFIYDAGICHGYFGLVIIFQLLNKIIPHPKLYQAAQSWLQYGLEKYKREGISSLYTYDLIENKRYEDFSFLTGYSGIGLVLLGVLTDEPNWADCLLMA